MMDNAKKVKATEDSAPKAPAIQIKATKPIVVLRIQKRALDCEDVEELEKKYSDKFGCKVVILESNLEMVDVINS